MAKMKKKQCPDCGVGISRNGTKCRSCARKSCNRPRGKGSRVNERHGAERWVKVKCFICGKGIVRRWDSAKKYKSACSKKCREEIYKKKRMRVHCAKCNKIGMVIPSIARKVEGGFKKWFCSSKCSGHKRGSDGQAGPGSSHFECIFCGKIFIKNKKAAAKSARLFCSQTCCKNYNYGEGNWTTIKEMRKIKCRRCEKQVLRRVGHLNTGTQRGKFCSRECYYKYQIDQGKKNRIKGRCQFCKKEFEYLHYRIPRGYNRRVYCSRGCHLEKIRWDRITKKILAKREHSAREVLQLSRKERK